MAHSLSVGAIRCHILSDGQHHADGGGFFGLVPRLLWQRVITPDENNLIPVDARSLLIESSAGLILVDTGNGDKLDAKARARMGLPTRNERLIGELRAVGASPEDVEMVLLTHFHGDHVGGATRRDSSGKMVPTFPRARYLGQRLELADASFPNERTAATYLRDNFQPLLDAGVLEPMDGPRRLARGVRTQIVPGHTAALQAVWVEEGGESLLFVGDAANWAVHLERLAWVPAFDVFPLQSIETKRVIRAEALERNTLLVFQHDAQVIAGRLVEGERGPVVQAELRKEAMFDESAAA